MTNNHDSDQQPVAARTPAWRANVVISTLLSFGLLTTSSVVQAGDVKARFGLTATPRVIDEGELVEFGFSNLTCFDFEDGSGGGRSNASWANHRFVDNRLSGLAHSWSFETEDRQDLVRTSSADAVSQRRVSTKRAFPPREKVTAPTPASTSPPAAAGSASDSGSSSSPEAPSTSSSECSCACDQRAFADDLCEFFCEQAFATCENQ